jgi:ankyrin repeat protein
MKRLYLIIFLIVFIISISGSIYSLEYSWDLINALYINDFDVIEKIISSNINKMSELDKRIVMNYAINYSSGENTLKACELLLRYNIQPTAFDLYTAIIRNRQNSTIQFLLQNGAVPNGEILLLTMERQRFDLASDFIKSGVDVNYQYSLSRRDADGMTPLLLASKWGNFEIVKLLIEAEAKINVQAVNGDTALSIARKSNNDAIYNYLLENGAIEHTGNIPY